MTNSLKDTFTDYHYGGVSDKVKAYIDTQTGWFKPALMYQDLGLDRKSYSTAHGKLTRLVKDGVLESKNQSFRRVDNGLERINWEEASGIPLQVSLPFELEKYALVYEGEVILIQGEKSGTKTLLTMEAARENANKGLYTVDYFSSELYEQQIKDRNEQARVHRGIKFKEWKDVNFYFRLGDFAQVLDPDHLTFIDYLNVIDDYTLMAGLLEAIYKKVKTGKGFAWVCVQKNVHTQFGMGGQGLWHRPSLIMTLYKGDYNGNQPYVLEINVAKKWTGETDPVGLQLDFWITKGYGTEIENDWRHPPKKHRQY